MPRRRGEYRLTKSTSFTVFPDSSTDKGYYFVTNTDNDTYMTKRNLTITADNYAFLINDAYEKSPSPDQESQQQEQQKQEKEKCKNGYHRELSRIFSRNFVQNHITDHSDCLNARKKHQCRTTSHESSFRNSLKYPFEKMKLHATVNQKYCKREPTSSTSGKLFSFMNALPEIGRSVQRNGFSGKDRWRKPRKIHRSKSGAQN
uniref:Uncharacterized protein n=1 Tax=Setaria digitata TaxID=48799 RepID=A0A915PQJ9_9BILA